MIFPFGYISERADKSKNTVEKKRLLAIGLTDGLSVPTLYEVFWQFGYYWPFF